MNFDCDDFEGVWGFVKILYIVFLYDIKIGWLDIYVCCLVLLCDVVNLYVVCDVE